MSWVGGDGVEWELEMGLGLGFSGRCWAWDGEDWDTDYIPRRSRTLAMSCELELCRAWLS